MLTEERYLCMGCMSRLDENGKCHCGYDENEPEEEFCLPVRSVVGERYLVGRVSKINGEGIIYIGFDRENEEKVFIHEFMPQKIARRNELTGEVAPVPGLEAEYKTLMTDFFDLFDALRNFRHTVNLFPISDIVRDKNTVYAVTKFIKTISYSDYLAHNGGEFTWPQVKKLFMPLFTTLTYLHGNGFVHRGISPESIRVNAKGQLLLCGFGTASVYTKNSTIDASLSAGYSAPEQYSESSWQGEWTDVYAVAAVLYKSLTGTLPVSADLRRSADNLCAPEELDHNLPSNVSDAIMNAMRVSVEDRTKSIDEFTAELLESTSSNTKHYDLKTDGEDFFKKVSEETKKPVEHEETRRRKRRVPWGFVACLVFVALLIGFVAFLFRFPETLGFGSRHESSESSTSTEDISDVEQGDYTIAVPNFVGRKRENVEGNSQYSQFTLVFEEEHNPSYTEGMIFEQSVNYRTQVEEGAQIVLKVSLGPETVPMPLCTGRTLEEVTAELNAAGISFQAVPNFSTEYEYNVVYEQSIAAGEPVAIGNTMTKVYIYYGAQERNDTSVSIGGSYDDDEGKIVIGGH